MGSSLLANPNLLPWEIYALGIIAISYSFTASSLGSDNTVPAQWCIKKLYLPLKIKVYFHYSETFMLPFSGYLARMSLLGTKTSKKEGLDQWV